MNHMLKPFVKSHHLTSDITDSLKNSKLTTSYNFQTEDQHSNVDI